MPKRPAPEFDEELYALAEKFQAANANDLRGMALLAYEHRAKLASLRQLSFQWARDARRMAAAVSRWPDWFMPTDGMPARITEVDEAITLFGLAAIPEDEATKIFRLWRNHSWRSWQVKEYVDRENQAAREAAGTVKRLRCKATVREIGPHTIILSVASENLLQEGVETLWSGMAVKVLLVQDG
jgi:hypothetical protein